MENIELSNGLKLEVDENNLDDMELLDDLYESQTTDPLKVTVVINKILGKDNKKKLYDKVRDKRTGRVSTKIIEEALMEILTKMNEGKNS